MGKALIMHLPEREIGALLPPEKLIGRTERTIVSVDRLLAELAVSRERGYAVDDCEDEQEGRGVAAPVFAAEGSVAGSVGLAGSISQIRKEDLNGLGAAIRATAQKISVRMGFIEDLTRLGYYRPR